MNKRQEIFLHLAFWAFMLITPLAYMRNGISLVQYLLNCMSPLLVMIVFYVNYLWLAPRYFGTVKHRYYWAVNIVMVVVLGLFMHYWMSHVRLMFDSVATMVHPRDGSPSAIDTLIFAIHDMISLAISAAVGTAINLAMRWRQIENDRLEAEAAAAKAELRALRSQISPHFLLNTLNNIYALAAFDSKRAQKAIQQLSQLLRHLLYDDPDALVKLDDDMKFVENYINLMKIRLADNVEVIFNYTPPARSVFVTSLIGIGLIENAFKHGVSPTEPSFIHISVYVDEMQVVCDIQNSYHPKTDHDRSGHGIGLQQMMQRLSLSYSNRYQWQHGVSEDGKVYRSLLRLDINSAPVQQKNADQAL